MKPALIIYADQLLRGLEPVKTFIQESDERIESNQFSLFYQNYMTVNCITSFSCMAVFHSLFSIRHGPPTILPSWEEILKRG